MDYLDFIKTKHIEFLNSWIEVEKEDLNSNMFDYQKQIVKKALEKWKYAIFADCGLWKTLMQLEWCEQIYKKEWWEILILAPLAVSKQTKKEWLKFGININIATCDDDIIEWINITNYEKLEKFSLDRFKAVVLDESSILKSFTWKIAQAIIDWFSHTKYKLACSATPSPNDFTELWNHCEFLNVMSKNEMLSMFFINDCADNWEGWRLKMHSVNKFWQFVWSWAVMLRKPSDLWDDICYDIKWINYHQQIIDLNTNLQEWQLFDVEAKWLNEVRQARKNSLSERIKKTLEIIAKYPDEQFLIWCDFNVESEELKKAIKWSYEVKWSDNAEYKEQTMLDFSDWKVKYLITKPSIAWFGMNWQNCNKMIFCWISDSYESFYQAIRRCWRYWQQKEVDVFIVIWDKEINSLNNILKKQSNHELMFDKMSENVLHYFNFNYIKMNNNNDTIITNNDYTIMNWDSCQRIKELEDNSIDYSIFSPPFSDLYTYSDSEYDMGNSKNDDEFYKHFKFLVKDLFRVLKPWRNLSFHCMNLPTSKFKSWFIGIKDFRGDLIRMFQDEWFIYHSEVCIWKNPVVAMQRTKALWLLHKTVKSNSTMARMWLPDYLVTMRKPWECEVRVTHTPEEFSVDDWQKIASPIWTDINQSQTLQYTSAKENNDEKHICPLQLDVIRRGIYLYTNKWDRVLSPFMWIGSEWYISLQLDRKFTWIELKKSYFESASKNLQWVAKKISLF